MIMRNMKSAGIMFVLFFPFAVHVYGGATAVTNIGSAAMTKAICSIPLAIQIPILKYMRDGNDSKIVLSLRKAIPSLPEGSRIIQETPPLQRDIVAPAVESWIESSPGPEYVYYGAFVIENSLHLSYSLTIEQHAAFERAKNLLGQQMPQATKNKLEYHALQTARALQREFR